jgi:hypothetical protein
MQHDLNTKIQVRESSPARIGKVTEHIHYFGQVAHLVKFVKEKQVNRSEWLKGEFICKVPANDRPYRVNVVLSDGTELTEVAPECVVLYMPEPGAIPVSPVILGYLTYKSKRQAHYLNARLWLSGVFSYTEYQINYEFIKSIA